MLIGAGTRLTSGPLIFLGAASLVVTERNQWTQPGMLRGFHMGEATVISGVGISKTAGFPNGYEHPGAWSLPTKGGGLAAYTAIYGVGDITTAQLAMGRALSADLTGSGDITTASLALVVSFLTELTGSGTLNGSLSGTLNMAADLLGDGDITAAMGAIIGLTAALVGTGTLDGSNLKGLASLSAEILSYGELTPEGLRDAIFGKSIDGKTFETIMQILVAVAAGKTIITDLGGGNATVEFRNLQDTLSRVTADMASSTRTSVAITED